MNRTVTILLLAVGSLVALSVVMLASATMLRGGDSLLHTWVLRQAVFCVIGFVALGLMARIDYHLLQRFAWPIYGICLLLLVLTLTPLGTLKNGAQRWLFGVQPSEFSKLGLVVTLAWFGARFSHRMGRFFSGVLGMGVIAAPPVLLILVEPDKGTAVLLALVTFLLLLVAGVRWWHVALPALIMAGSFVLLVMNSEYAMKRVNAFRHPELNKDDYLQVQESLYALGAGGLEGTGLGRGAFKFNIPEQHTDFIFPVVGEELGLGFTLGVVGVFLVILVCGALITHAAPDTFGTLLAAGITFVIAAQAAVNLGVVTDLLPNKGMPLPFVSRGGTGMVVMLALAGLLVSVARQGVVGVSPLRSKGDPFEAMDTDLPE
jgi:cell division protein FtsW